MQVVIYGRLLKCERETFKDGQGSEVAYLDISILQEPDFVVRASGSPKNLSEPYPVGQEVRCTAFIGAKSAKSGAPALKVQIREIEAAARSNGQVKDAVKVT